MNSKKLPFEEYQFDDFILDNSFFNYALNKKQNDGSNWEAWLSHNPKNKKIAIEAKMAILNLQFNKQELSSDFVLSEWYKLSNRLHLDKTIAPVQSKNFLRKKIWKYAAIASIVLFFAGALYYYTSASRNAKVVYSQEVVVPKGEINKVLLSDSTLVYINSDSKLKYSNFAGKQKRDVFLEGEAYFDVAHQAKKAFIVHTLNNDIIVHGTAFDVYAYPDENIFRTTLSRGKISVSHNHGKAVNLKVKQTYLFNKISKQASILETPDIQSFSSWKDGIITFSNQRFTEILRILERAYNIKFELRNKKVGTIRYTGSFTTNENIDFILDVIKSTTPFEYENLQDTTIIIK